MKRSARQIQMVILACAASAGAHAALVPEHLEHERALGVAFGAAAVALVLSVVTLTARPESALARSATALLLAALIAAYLVNVTTGLPGLAGEAEAVDALGFATKLVEVLGLAFVLQLHSIDGRRRASAVKEVPR
jgi:hypothetical protein